MKNEPVGVEWVKSRLPPQSLRRDSLNNIPLDDMLLQIAHKSLVPLFTDITNSLLPPLLRTNPLLSRHLERFSRFE